MFYEYQIIFGILAATLGIVAFFPYFRDIFRGTTKPHVFTWFVWTLLTGITFFIQLSEGGGIGAWVTGIESLCCAGVAVFAYTRGEKKITRFDWICFGMALLATISWLFAHQPLLAVVLVVCADALAFAPTFHKSYWKPNEETAMNYALGAARWPLAIFALQSLTLTTFLYPAAIAIFDMALVAMLLIRRRQLAKRERGDTPHEIGT